jgi:Transient receptor potential (TRP) ion channel
VSFVPLVVACTFGLSRKDSATEQTIAAFTILCIFFLVGFPIYQILCTSSRSKEEVGTPAYHLYTDGTMLNKWGFIYAPFRATSLRFIIPVYVQLPLKGLFVSCGQGSPVAQAVGLFTIDLAFVVLITVFRPYALRSTNVWNIAISVVILLNSALLLLFSNIFGVSV